MTKNKEQLKRYCPMCEKIVPVKETECKLCGMPTEKCIVVNGRLA